MYIFKKEKRTRFNQKCAAKVIGLTTAALSNILNGKVACRKVVAFSITKYLDNDAEILDYFTEVGE